MSEDKFSHVKHEDFGSGMSFSHGYKDFDEMMAHMAEQEAKANASLLPEQAAMIDVEEDQWFMNIAVNPNELFIAGEAWSLGRAASEELESYKVTSESLLSPEDRAAFKSSMRMTADSRKRGYIFGRGFSTIEPDGELGSTHVANMWPIDEAAFNEAREQNWQPDLKDDNKSPNLRLALWHLWMKHRLGR